MFDAQTAYENTVETINMNMTNEINDVLNEIRVASEEGEFSITLDNLYDTTTKKLKELGYKVKFEHFGLWYTISWRKPIKRGKRK